jgi:hypothetical protein
LEYWQIGETDEKLPDEQSPLPLLLAQAIKGRKEMEGL